MGGLATALRLAHRGERVIVLEKTDQVGGRNRLVRVGDCEFDGGPTLVMMLDPFRRLFRDVGEKLEDHLALTLCDPSYRTFFSDGTRLDATTDAARMREQMRAMGAPRDAERYSRLLKDLKSLYEEAVPAFVERNYDHLGQFINPNSLKLVAKHRMLSNLGKRIGKYVEDERLRMLFSFQSMYLGLSPFEAPWVYAVLTWMEYGEGIWYPKGGVVEIARVIARLAIERGAEIRLNLPVAAVEGRCVRLVSGDTIAAKAIIVNADLPYAENQLLKNPRRKPRRSSCSAYMMYLDYEGVLAEMRHHNVFFGPDFAGNLEAIFNRLEIPAEPAFYAAISARTDRPKAPDGHENLMVLVPCPNLDRHWKEEDGQAMRESVFSRLELEVGFERGRIRAIKTYGPPDWAADLNLDRGAAFGVSHHFLQSAYFRPSNRSATPGVYFVGASTTPGNGLPMVLISAELVEQSLDQDGILG